MDKRVTYIGLGALALAVVYFSVRKDKLKEVVDPTVEKKNFDHTRLPFSLRPPSKIADDQIFSKVPSKKNSMVGITAKPRMDKFAGYKTW